MIEDKIIMWQNLLQKTYNTKYERFVKLSWNSFRNTNYLWDYNELSLRKIKYLKTLENIHFTEEEIRMLLQHFKFSFLIENNKFLNLDFSTCSYYNIKNGYDDQEFSISGWIMNRKNTDFEQCGQCQLDIFQNHQLIDEIIYLDKLHMKEFKNLSLKELNKMFNIFILIFNNSEFVYVNGITSDIKFSQYCDLIKR